MKMRDFPSLVGIRPKSLFGVLMFRFGISEIGMI